jgi:hypothetical protein
MPALDVVAGPCDGVAQRAKRLVPSADAVSCSAWRHRLLASTADHRAVVVGQHPEVITEWSRRPDGLKASDRLTATDDATASKRPRMKPSLCARATARNGL